MALFMIERDFATELHFDSNAVKAVEEINEDCGVKWLYSFLSADKRKTYCLYEALNSEDIRLAARKANIPAGAIIELTGQVRPEQFA